MADITKHREMNGFVENVPRIKLRMELPGRHRQPTDLKIVRSRTYIKKVVIITELPDEITLKIFEYLDAQDLLIAAQVCKSWHVLANDNSLWRPIFQTYGVPTKDGGKRDSTDRSDQGASNSHSAQYLKTLCIKSCVTQRNKKAFNMVKKINPYTGILQVRDLEKAMKYVGVYWQLALVDDSGNEHYLYNKDTAWHLMSISLRWFDLEMLPLRQIKQLRMYSCNPLFFDKKTGNVIKKGPYQRSLLQSFDIRWSAWVSTNKPIGSDDMINLHSLPGGLSIAVWKDGGELAYICVGLHANQLMSRCLKGNSLEPYTPSAPQKMFDDIDSAFGLHSYSCTIQLRSMRQGLWDQQFRSLDASPGTGLGYATFVLIGPGQRQIFDKDLVFPWKTDAFKGKIQNVSWLDLTITDEMGKVFWSVSSLVKASNQAAQQSFSFDFDYSDNNKCCIDYMDQVGKLHMEIEKTDDSDGYITNLVIMLSLAAINNRFGTNYK